MRKKSMAFTAGSAGHAHLLSLAMFIKRENYMRQAKCWRRPAGNILIDHDELQLQPASQSVTQPALITRADQMSRLSSRKFLEDSGHNGRPSPHGSVSDDPFTKGIMA
jgi:hypothetical protein